MHNLTFVIFTFNEESRIERVIQNYQNYGKVLLADGGSNDRTREIADANNCIFFERPKTDHIFVENSVVMEALYKVITTDWIFLGYADELMSKTTLDEVSNIINSDKHDAIKIFRKNYFYGDYCYDAFKSANNRFFKTWAYDFTDNFIHQMGKPKIAENKIYALPDKYFIHHFIDGTIDSHLSKLNRYTNAELESISELKAKKSIFFFLFRIAKNVLKNYFFERGYKSDFGALTLTEMAIFYEMIKNMKIYEAENKITNVVIDERNNFRRNEILQEFV